MSKANAEVKLYRSIATAALKGNKIEPGSFGQTDYDEETATDKTTGHVCLCGAVLVAAGVDLKELDNYEWTGEDIIKTAARKLGITIKQAASLNNGFEGEPKSEREVVGTGRDDFDPLKDGVDTDWYIIGKNLRKVWNDAQKE